MADEQAINQQQGDATLSREDRDTIGEMTNISMGAAVSTMSALLNQECDLSIPEVAEFNGLSSLKEPFGGDDKIFISVKYTKGFNASVGFVMRALDAKHVANQMLGDAGDEGAGPLSELQVAGIAEAMNQMMDASATSMSSVIHEAIEVDSPQVHVWSLDTIKQLMPKLETEAFTEVTFEIKIAGGRNIGMVQYLVASEARSQVTQLLAVEPEKAPAPVSQPNTEPVPPSQPLQQGAPAMSSPQSNPPEVAKSPAVDVDPVTVRPVEFASFDNQPAVYGEENKNLSLVMDVNLSLTVELGKTSIPIKDVLELTRGSVIELDRVAGEPVDLLANGKLIAKGEVVVIEDNFGLRITSIVSPADRLRGL